MLGLELGALIFTLRSTTFLQWSMAMCIVWLLMDVSPFTTMLLHHDSEIDYRHTYISRSDIHYVYLYI